MLLSDNDKSLIRSSIRKVTDTFFNTPISYHLGISKYDRYGEGDSSLDYYTIIINGMVEDLSNSQISLENSGVNNNKKIKISLNIEYIDSLGLISSDFKHKLNEANDYISYKGELYKVNSIYVDGPLDIKGVLLIIEAYFDINTEVKFEQVINNYGEIPVDEIIVGNLSSRVSAIEQSLKDVDDWNADEEPAW